MKHAVAEASLETRWNIKFKNPELIRQALVHSSLQKGEFQRLEFLGDRVVALVISAWLYHLSPTEPEGALAKRLAHLVSERSLYTIACALELEKKVFWEAPKGPKPVRILSDACEALWGALYLDQDFDTVTRILQQEWRPFLQIDAPPPIDPKSALQEYLQNIKEPPPVYTLLHQTGPSHAPVFTVHVMASGRSFEATGHSKREAQQGAAAKTLAYLTREDTSL